MCGSSSPSMSSRRVTPSERLTTVFLSAIEADDSTFRTPRLHFVAGVYKKVAFADFGNVANWGRRNEPPPGERSSFTSPLVAGYFAAKSHWGKRVVTMKSPSSLFFCLLFFAGRKPEQKSERTRAAQIKADENFLIKSLPLCSLWPWR